MSRLTREDIQFYKDNGYIHLRKFIKEDELNKLSVEYDNLFKRKNQAKTESLWMGSDKSFRESDSQYTVKGIHNLQMHHAIFGKLLYNDDLLDALEDIMNTKNIILHHTKAHFKPPENGGSYPMHQDYPYFPYHNDSVVSAFVHVDEANPENGGLFVYPGSHKLGPLEDFGPKEGSNFHYVDQVKQVYCYSFDDPFACAVLPQHIAQIRDCLEPRLVNAIGPQKKFPIEKATPVVAEAGDVVIFSYLLIHGSTPNLSSRPRRMFLAQFADAHDSPKGIQTAQPGRGWVLRGVNLNRDATIANRNKD